MFQLSERSTQVLWRSVCGHIFTLYHPPKAILKVGGGWGVWGGGAAVELSNWPWILPSSPPYTWISEGVPSNKTPFDLRKWTQGQIAFQTFWCFFFYLFFFGLVWFVVLQLHLIPTGKPSSGTDFRVPELGLENWEGTEGWFSSGEQASSQCIWLKGA